LANRSAQNQLPVTARTRSRARRSVTHLCLAPILLMVLFFIGVVGPACGSDCDSLTAKAVELMSSGRYDEALPVQERIAALDPKDAQIRIELGFNYLNHQARPADAVRVLLEVVDLDSSARNLTFLAQAQMGNGDRAGAECTLHKAIAADSGYPHCYAVLIRLLGDSGRLDEVQGIVDEAADHGIDVDTLSTYGA
jgi:tetratricopeptide (TPR) repeat protein